jgi:fucose permease
MTEPPTPRALVSVATMFFVNGAVYGSWAPRLPEIRERAGLSLSELGVVLSAAALFALTCTLWVGILVDRVGSRRATGVAGVSMVLGLAVIGLADSPVRLAVALALVTGADVVMDVAMNVQVTQVSEARSTPIMSRVHGLWSLGTVLGGVVAAPMAAASVSLTAHLSITALLLGATIVAAVPGLLRVDRSPAAGHLPGTGRQARRAGAPLVLLGFLAISMELISADWSALRQVEDLGTAPATAGFAFAAFSAGMLVGRFSGDSLVARLGARGTVNAGGVLAAVGIAVGMLAPDASISTAGFAAAGLGVAPAFPQIYAAAARTPGLGAGTGIAFMTTGQRIGALVFPFAVGALADTDALAVGQAAALVTLPCVAGLLVMIRRRGSGWDRAGA